MHGIERRHFGDRM